MYIEIFYKILSESLLSLYPVFVKYINIPFGLELWSRFFIYVFIAFFFIDKTFILKSIFSPSGILLSFITILHVYASYRGFELLDSGIAYSIFYTYPLMILLMAKEKINYLIIFAIIGVILIDEGKTKKEKFNNDDIFIKKDVKENFKYEGICMMILAAFTEALIYFTVKNIKTNNNWNHVFISYAFGAILFTTYYYKKIQDKNIVKPLTASIFINIFIGLIGYLLRFYSMSRLTPIFYSILSYFGILMAYVYGVIINKDEITIKKIVGTLFILIPNIYILLKPPSNSIS